MKIRCSSLFVLALGAASLTFDLHAVGTGVLAVSGRANANLSMTSSGSFVAAVWSASLADGTTDIYASVSSSEDAAFGAPVRVNRTPGDARANGEQPPRVALAARSSGPPELTVIWLSKRDAATVLLSARSSDGGKSFSAAAVVPGADAAGNRGWQSLVADSQGAVHAAWLDHRKLAERDSQMASMHHHNGDSAAGSTVGAKPDGVAMAQLSQVYVATLGGSPAQPIAGGVCYCCKTAIASGRPGEIYVAWRNVYPGNLRDIAFSVSRDGGRTFSGPARVSEDHWMIEGCPEDGPVLAVDRQSRVHVVWPTVVSEKGETVKALFHAVTRDGKTFSERTRLPSSGQANHPQITMANDGSLFVAWDESGSGARKINLARGVPNADGQVSFDAQASSIVRAGTYPALTPLNEGVLLAWTTGQPAASTIRVEMIK
jgi:hypothetical protein